MKKSLALLLSTIFCTFSLLTFAQQLDKNNPNSKVVMSEADINSLVKVLVKKRAEQKRMVQNIVPPSYYSGYNREVLVKDVSLENTLLKLHLTLLQDQIMNRAPQFQGREYPIPPNSTENDSRKIKEMEYEISRLKNQLKESSKNVSTAPTVLYGSDQNGQGENTITTIDPTNNNDEKKELMAMQESMDSLMAVMQINNQAKTPEAISYSSEFDSLQQELAALKKEMIVKKEAPTDYDVLKAKFANYSKDIYFANNSTVVDNNASQVVKELKELLETNRNLDVLLNGFASNKGAPTYNEKLSTQRTETIKKMLIQEGIHPMRILTQHHGIDYNASSDSQARRVMISLLVRK